MHLLPNTIHDCGILGLPRIHNRSGNITAINNFSELPFAVKRIYYLYDIPSGEGRGGHAHKNLYQLIVAAGGSFEILLKDGLNQKTFTLDQPYTGLLVVPGIWREICDFSAGSICLVLASDKYLEHDYIRDYSEYKTLRNIAWKYIHQPMFNQVK
jgi:hypothetical protein